jgi:hypothetical protein
LAGKQTVLNSKPAYRGAGRKRVNFPEYKSSPPKEFEMNTYSNLTEDIILSKSGLKAQAKSKFKGNNYPKTHICSISEIAHQVQRTNVYINTHGDYLFSARDMGWNHPFWTKMRANILADTVSSLPYTWEKIEIPFYLEDRLTTSILEVGAKYVIIRNHTETGLKSTVIVAGSTEAEIDVGPTIKSTLVFAPYIGGKMVERLVLSPNIEVELKLARTKALVEMAQNCRPHILCEGIPDDTDFIHRLSAYLQADNMLINGDLPLEKTTLVDMTGLVNGYDLVDLGKLLSSTPLMLSGWKMEFSYRGLPELQTKMLKSDDAFTLDEHRLWVKATLVGEPSAWNREIGYPQGEEECPDMTWLTD